MSRAKEFDPERGTYVTVSRLTMERSLGRPLRSDELVHHINGDHTDDRLENLEVVTAAEHRRRHLAMGNAGWTNDVLFPEKVPLGTLIEHGNYLRYNLGCRCDACVDASARRRREEKAWKATYRAAVARLGGVGRTTDTAEWVPSEWNQGSRLGLAPTDAVAYPIVAASSTEGLAERRVTLSPSVQITCWCERKVVDVDREVFDRGETLSCGNRRCKPFEVAS